MSFLKSAFVQGLCCCILFSLVAAPAVQARESVLSENVTSSPIVPVFIPMASAGVIAQAASAPATTSAAMAQAEIEAVQNTSTPLWLGAGCLLGIIGVILGYVLDPTPPLSSMVGKPPEYVAMYSARYKEVGKKQQGKMALIGCAVSGVAYAVLYLVEVSAAVASY